MERACGRGWVRFQKVIKRMKKEKENHSSGGPGAQPPVMPDHITIRRACGLRGAKTNDARNRISFLPFSGPLDGHLSGGRGCANVDILMYIYYAVYSDILYFIILSHSLSKRDQKIWSLKSSFGLFNLLATYPLYPILSESVSVGHNI